MAVFNRIGPYEIEQEIGRGGMAVVFLARDSRNGRQVALKLVREGNDREAVDILEAERRGAELQQQFCAVSERVPAVYEHGSDSGYFYVAMEYLEGENLSDAIARGPMALAPALGIAIELCRFVEDAHGFEAAVGERQLRSLLHGDLKPRNIRLSPDGRVKVLDFGIAKALSMSRKVTRNDFGSVAYLSPERLETGDVDQHADFWAIGALLYELLTGRQAFQASDTRRLEKQIVARRPPAQLAEVEPASIRAIVGKLLGPYPTERYASAREIREDLERCAAAQPTIAEAEGWPHAATDEGTRRTHAPLPIEDSEATRRTTPPVIPPPLPGLAPTERTTPPPLPVLGAAARTTSPPLPVLPLAAAVPVGAAVRPVPRSSTFRRRLRTAVVILAIIMFVKEYWIASAAARVAAAVPSTELDRLSELWNEYEDLSERSYLDFATNDLGSALTRHTLSLADRVVANYRTPQPTVREAQWRMVQAAVSRALAARPRDRMLRATLRYSEGHLNRIDGEARKARRQTADAQRKFADAVSAFREAAELRPDWPDPYLGLSRTFIYGLEDVERGADALQRAERAGYTPGVRDAAQLGDGYRARADTLVRSADDLSGLTQERDYLTRAAELYREALAQYTKAAGYAGVPRNVVLAQRGLRDVEGRLLSLPESEFDGEPDKPWD
jgi:eukaryotic-like serine/threonine-protein kinase